MRSAALAQVHGGLSRGRNRVWPRRLWDATPGASPGTDPHLSDAHRDGSNPDPADGAWLTRFRFGQHPGFNGAGGHPNGAGERMRLCRTDGFAEAIDPVVADLTLPETQMAGSHVTLAPTAGFVVDGLGDGAAVASASAIGARLDLGSRILDQTRRSRLSAARSTIWPLRPGPTPKRQGENRPAGAQPSRDPPRASAISKAK